jgi:hypothetical protein
LTGAIRGTRLPAEIKLALVGAITEANDAGFPIVRACEVLMFEARRFHRWLKGRDPKTPTAADLSDDPRSDAGGRVKQRCYFERFVAAGVPPEAASRMALSLWTTVSERSTSPLGVWRRNR